MKKLPQEIIDDLMNDQDFLSLDDAGQDEILGDIQKKMGINEPSENILQKAAKSIKKNPLNVFPGVAAYNYGMEKKNEMLDPFLQANASLPGIFPEAQNAIMKNVVTDPMGYMGAQGGTKLLSGAGKGAKALGNSLFKPSKAYGEALSKAEGKVDFLKIISKHENDPVVKKVLQKAKIFDKYGGTSMGEGGSVSDKLANLTAKESQNLINDVKLGKDALIQGKRIKPNEIGLVEFFSDLSKAQSELPGMSGAKKLYGVSKNVGRLVKSNVGKFVTGSVIGAGAKTAYDALK